MEFISRLRLIVFSFHECRTRMRVKQIIQFCIIENDVVYEKV